jgi:hypothetical protein
MENVEQTIRKFNRFELKYVITLQQAELFKASLRKYMLPDIQGNGRYSLGSLYYDSPDLRCYHEKENGLRFRRKLRIRHYVNNEPLTEQTPVYVEIKQRVDRVTQKRREALSYGDALRLCNDRLMPDCMENQQPFLDEVYAFLWQYNLRPTSIVRYHRQAFNGTEFDPGLRVTFDTDLRFQPNQLRLHENASTLPILPPGQVVMEIKVNERIPYWLTGMIADHNLELKRISKYCRSIEAARETTALQLRRLPAESSEDVLSSTLSVFNTLKQKMGIQSP